MTNTNTTQLLKSLESLYLEGQFDGARDLILKNKSELSPLDFHFILGTLDAKTGDYAAGRYHLEKTVKLGNIGPEVFHNLAAVKQKTGLMGIEGSTHFYDVSINNSKSLPNDLYLSWLLILILGILLFIKKLKKKKLLLVVLIVIGIVPYLTSQLYLSKKSYAIALKDISLKEGPSSIYEQIGEIKAGSKIIVGEIYKDYYFVEHPINLNGWVSKDNMALY